MVVTFLVVVTFLAVVAVFRFSLQFLSLLLQQSFLQLLSLQPLCFLRLFLLRVLSAGFVSGC